METCNLITETYTKMIGFKYNKFNDILYANKKINVNSNELPLKSLLEVSNVYGITFFATPSGFIMMNNVNSNKLENTKEIQYDAEGYIINENIFVYSTKTHVLQLKLSYDETKLLVMLEKNLLLLNIQFSNDPLQIIKCISCNDDDNFFHSEWIGNDKSIIILTKNGILYNADITKDDIKYLTDNCQAFSCLYNCNEFDYKYILKNDFEKIYTKNINNETTDEESIKLNNNNYENLVPIYVKILTKNIFCIGYCGNFSDNDDQLLILGIYHKIKSTYNCVHAIFVEKYDINKIDLIYFHLYFLNELNLIVCGTSITDNFQMLIYIDDNIYNQYFSTDNSDLKPGISISINTWYNLDLDDTHSVIYLGGKIKGINFDYRMTNQIKLFMGDPNPTTYISCPIPTLQIIDENYKLTSLDMFFSNYYKKLSDQNNIIDIDFMKSYNDGSKKIIC